MTRGMDCKNPLNIMHNPEIRWQGEIVPTTDPDNRLCTFDTIVDGIRAATITLLSYYYHDSCDSVRTIINRWAPPTVDNNQTQAYISFMCQSLNVGQDAALTIPYSPFLQKWVKAQAHFEQGGDFCTDDDIAQGVKEALQHDGV